MNKPSTSNKTSETLKVDNFRVIRAHMFESGDVTFDLELNSIRIYGLKVVEHKDGDFISFPQRKGKDGKYYSFVWAKFSSEDTKTILAAVEKELNK